MPQPRHTLAQLRRTREALAKSLEQIDALIESFGAEPTQGELERQKHDREAPEGLKRIKSIFGHKRTTLPNKAEIKEYNLLAKTRIRDHGIDAGQKIFYEEIDQTALFYSFREDGERKGEHRWPTSALRLLANWDEVQDRAAQFLKDKPRSTNVLEFAQPEPEGWRERLIAEGYPADLVNGKRWGELDSQLRGICM